MASRGATPSIAELTRRVKGINAGSIISPTAAHSFASARAAASVGNAKSLPPGVLAARLSSGRAKLRFRSCTTDSL
jgi:hypothetical protein